jgi:hypothetical protein
MFVRVRDFFLVPPYLRPETSKKATKYNGSTVHLHLLQQLACTACVVNTGRQDGRTAIVSCAVLYVNESTVRFACVQLL